MGALEGCGERRQREHNGEDVIYRKKNNVVAPEFRIAAKVAVWHRQV